MKETINQKIENYTQDMVNKICDIIKIPSISDEDKAEENMPFGRECNNALEYILNLGKELGFRTKNVDGYCGYIEFGEGEELIGIIGHLDVVPADETDWKITKPFEPKIYENKIYGRGAIDDKGPTIAALYAMKTIKDIIKANKRVRLIVGLNEEKSWKCIKYYKEREEIPSLGFSPDADFPCIYAEKSIIHPFLEETNNKNEKIIIEKIDCQNNALNVVPKYCECILKIRNINQNEIIKNIKEIIKNNKFNVKITQIDNNHIELISNGKSSHAAHPDLGENAISQLLLLINKIFKKYKIENQLVEFFARYIGNDYNGNLLEINKKDESGELTLNVGRLYIKPETDKEFEKIKIGMDLRVPINTEIEFVKNKFKEKISEYQNLNISFGEEINSLFIPKESKLVRTLTKIFNEITNKSEEPITIGGATFARAFPNCVSFGANMPHEKDLCHQADENIKIDNLIISAKIYANAIYELIEE